MGNRENTLNIWNYAAEEMCPTGVGSGDTTLLNAAHTAGDTSQSTLRNFAVTSAVSSSASGRSPPLAGGIEKQNEFTRAGEVPSISSAVENPVQSNQQNSGTLRKKEGDGSEFEKFPNSNTFVIWKMNFKSGVCPISSFPTETVTHSTSMPMYSRKPFSLTL